MEISLLTWSTEVYIYSTIEVLPRLLTTLLSTPKSLFYTLTCNTTKADTPDRATTANPRKIPNNPLIILRKTLLQVPMGDIRLFNPTLNMAYALFKSLPPANFTHELTPHNVMLHRAMPHLTILQISHTGNHHIRATPRKILLQITGLPMILKRAMDNLPVPDAPSPPFLPHRDLPGMPIPSRE
jgi:hypothetical protein